MTKGHAELSYGDYCLVQESVQGRSSMQSEALAMRPSDSGDGKYVFMSLSTKQMLLRTKWEQLPMTDDIIKRVQSMSSTRTWRGQDTHSLNDDDASGISCDEEESYQYIDPSSNMRHHPVPETAHDPQQPGNPTEAPGPQDHGDPDTTT